MKNIITATAVISFAAASASAAIYNEAIDGDLANIDSAGGTFFDVEIGINTVTGNIGSGGDTEDFVSFTINAGEALTAVNLTSIDLDPGNFSTGFRLYADLGTGFVQVSPGSFNSSNVGDNYLDNWDLSQVGGSAPLGPGSYAIALNELGGTDNGYSFDIVVVPAPGAAALLGVAGLAATRRRR